MKILNIYFFAVAVLALAGHSTASAADIDSFLTHIGLSREAIRYFATAGPNHALPITPAIAQRLDIDTTVTDGGQIRMPQEKPTPRRIAFVSATYIGLSGDFAPLLGLDPAFLRKQGSQRLKLGQSNILTL